MSQSSSMSDVSNGDDDNNDNNNINNNNNNKKDADKGYNLRPRKPINYRDTARGQASDDTDDNDDSTSRGRRRPPASRRGTRSRAGTGRRRPAAGSSNRGARSRSISASQRAADLDGDDDDNDIAPSTAPTLKKPQPHQADTFSVCTSDVADFPHCLLVAQYAPVVVLMRNVLEDDFLFNKELIRKWGYGISSKFRDGWGSVVLYQEEKIERLRETIVKLEAENKRNRYSVFLVVILKFKEGDRRLRVGVLSNNNSPKAQQRGLEMFKHVAVCDERPSDIVYGFSSKPASAASSKKVSSHLRYSKHNLLVLDVTPSVPFYTSEYDLTDPDSCDESEEQHMSLYRFAFKQEENECIADVDDNDIAPYLAFRAAALSPTETSTSKFTAADKDFYPINFSEQEVSEALKRGRGLTCPGQGPCSFSDVGGLGETIDIVRKTIRLPLLCPEFYSEFRIRPKKGLIFYGPPGVGKTMTARALVDACKSYTNHRIAFFMRKGSDILNSYVGQSEANVTKLFDAARQMSPSIIFLDEFDALGSIRTPNSHNHVESNVVSTLLALMDGLDDRGMVFVIAATNRLDAIDPAFRRPGRFDVEICFKVPDQAARKDILSKVTSSWTIDQNVIDAVAKRTDKFNGADLVALCEAAALEALERVNPTMVDCSDEDFPEELSITDIEVTIEDFEAAFKNVKSSCKRLQDK